MSALKSAELLKEINALNYEEEFIGKLLVHVTDEMKAQLAVMSGPKFLLNEKANELDNAELREIAEKWQYAVDKIEKTLKALNFRTAYLTTVNDIFDTVRVLTLANSSCTLQNTTETIPIDCNPKNLVYILSEEIAYLYENHVTEIEMTAEKVNDNVVISVNKPCEYNENVIKKLNSIASLDTNINVNVTNNLLKIVVQ